MRRECLAENLAQALHIRGFDPFHPWLMPFDKREPLTTGIRANPGLIHQLHTRGRDNKLTRYLHTHRILKSCIAIKTVEEKHCPPIAKLARAIPISPTPIAVTQV